MSKNFVYFTLTAVKKHKDLPNYKMDTIPYVEQSYSNYITDLYGKPKNFEYEEPEY